MLHLLALLDIGARNPLCEPPHPFDVTHALGDTDNAARIQHVERVRTFQHIIRRGQNQPCV